MKHPIMGFEHLHRHSDFSLMDGFARVYEYAELMKQINQKYLCITDHGVMGAIPQQIAESEKHGLVPLFGCELYCNSMQPKAEIRDDSKKFRADLSPEEQKHFDKSSHLLAIAYTNQGYENLVRLTSWAWVHGFYKKPRVNHDALMQFKEGIIFTSTCANSEIANALFSGEDEELNEEAAWKMVDKYVAMFGENFYLELMMLDFALQKPYDLFLLKVHEKYGIPIFMSCDCHYCKKEHSLNQRLQLLNQRGKVLSEALALQAEGVDVFELQEPNLWCKSEPELNSFWEEKFSDVIPYELFMQSKANSVEIARRAEGIVFDREIKLPKIPDAEEKLMEETQRGFKLRRCPQNPIYEARIKEEYELICSKGFASYFLIQKMMTDEARRVGPEILGFGDGNECVGPGRGSICGSLVAYCLRLHDVEPIHHDLLFSRFLSPARGGKQQKIRYTLEPIADEEVTLDPNEGTIEGTIDDLDSII
jgi:DNA polymerase-3 subunit alpha